MRHAMRGEGSAKIEPREKNLVSPTSTGLQPSLLGEKRRQGEQKVPSCQTVLPLIENADSISG